MSRMNGKKTENTHFTFTINTVNATVLGGGGALATYQGAVTPCLLHHARYLQGSATAARSVLPLLSRYNNHRRHSGMRDTSMVCCQDIIIQRKVDRTESPCAGYNCCS